MVDCEKASVLFVGTCSLQYGKSQQDVHSYAHINLHRCSRILLNIVNPDNKSTVTLQSFDIVDRATKNKGLLKLDFGGRIPLFLSPDQQCRRTEG